MLNIGFSIKIRQDGYIVEYFRMNSCTLNATVIDERGPFETHVEAETVRSEWHNQIGRTRDRESEISDLLAIWRAECL